jgi:hypothetical protein
LSGHCQTKRPSTPGPKTLKFQRFFASVAKYICFWVDVIVEAAILDILDLGASIRLGTFHEPGPNIPGSWLVVQPFDDKVEGTAVLGARFIDTAHREALVIVAERTWAAFHFFIGLPDPWIFFGHVLKHILEIICTLLGAEGPRLVVTRKSTTLEEDSVSCVAVGTGFDDDIFSFQGDACEGSAEIDWRSWEELTCAMKPGLGASVGLLTINTPP